MPPTTPSTDTQHERQMAKLRVVRVFREGGDWRLAAIHNDVPYSTARRAILSDGTEPKKRGGVHPSRVKMTVAVMAKLEELVDEYYRMTCIDMRDRLHSGLGVSVSRTSVHRALQGMLFSVKQLRVEKSTMNSSTNKAKRKAFVEKLNMHAERGDMIVFQERRTSTFTCRASKAGPVSAIARKLRFPCRRAKTCTFKVVCRLGQASCS